MVLTENTIVIEKSLEPRFLEEAEKYANSYHRVDNLRRVYGDDKIVIYVFDADGDTPWEIEKDTVEYLALETYYLDGEEPWSRFKDQNEESKNIAEWLKGRAPEDQYDDIASKISYSTVGKPLS